MKERNREETRGEETRGGGERNDHGTCAERNRDCIQAESVSRAFVSDSPKIWSQSVSSGGAAPLRLLSEMFQAVAFGRGDADEGGRSTSESSAAAAQTMRLEICLGCLPSDEKMKCKKKEKKKETRRDIESLFFLLQKTFFFRLKNGLVLSSLSSEKLDFPLSLQANSPSDQCSNVLMKNS